MNYLAQIHKVLLRFDWQRPARVRCPGSLAGFIVTLKGFELD